MYDDPILDELFTQVRAAHQRLARLEPQVADLAVRAPAAPQMPAVWMRTPAAATECGSEEVEAGSAWDRFSGWVAWLIDHYGLDGSRLPSCWWRHDPVVEELTALWIAHVEAYEVGGAAPIAWHAALVESLDRIGSTWCPTCVTGTSTCSRRSQPRVVER